MNPLAGFLVALVVVLVVCHGCGELLCRCGQPRVVGEIAGGVLLGPSVLGQLWPMSAGVLFPVETVAQLDRVAQLGLIFFMVSLGELCPDITVRRRVVGWVTAGSIGLPLAAGIGIGFMAGGVLAGSATAPATCAVFFGVALAITALPVLGRMLVDLHLDQTSVGATTIRAAAIGDLLAWTVLTLLIAGRTGTGHWSANALTVIVLLAVVLGIRRAMSRLDRLASREGPDQILLATLVTGAIGLGAVAELIGLHAAIGALVFGLALPRGTTNARRNLLGLRGVTLALLLPVFFAGVGLRMSLDELITPRLWWIFAGVLLVAGTTKIIGAGGGARVAGLPTADAWRIGVLMNCRGVTELILASIGLQHGLISPLGFTALVLVSAATGPLLRAQFSRPVMVGAIPGGVPA